MYQNKKRGFTLIELLVVIAIIAILSTFAVIALGNAQKKARDAKRQADLKTLQTAIELYANDHGDPPTSANWSTLESDLSSYLPGGLPEDPSSQTWVYCVNGSKYLVGVELEQDSTIAGDLDNDATAIRASSAYGDGTSLTGCIFSTGTTNALDCQDGTSGIVGASTGHAAVCLGSV